MKLEEIKESLDNFSKMLEKMNFEPQIKLLRALIERWNGANLDQSDRINRKVRTKLERSKRRLKNRLKVK